MLSSLPPAEVASAALRAKVMVIAFNKGVSVVRSNAFPVAVKSVVRAGISVSENGT